MRNDAFFTLLLAVFIALMGIGIIVPVMPVFAKELGAGGLALGMIIAAFSVSRGLLQPVVGILSDRWQRKNFLIAGLFIYGLVGLAIPLATEVNHLITIRAFHGVGSAMIVPIGMAYMSILAPVGEEGKYMSYLNIAVFCGIGCGPIIGGFLFDLYGFSSVFYTMAGLSFLAFVLVVRFMPVSVAAKQDRDRAVSANLYQMFHDMKTCGILLARYCTMIIMVPTMAFLPLLMSSWPDVTGSEIGAVIACRTLINACMQVPSGRAADKRSKIHLLALGIIVMSLAVLLIPEMKSFSQMAILYLLLGSAEAVIWAVLGAYASQQAKASYGHGTMMGIFSFAMSAGVFTGAILCGMSMDHWGIARAYHVAAAAVLLLSAAAVVMIVLGERTQDVISK